MHVGGLGRTLYPLYFSVEGSALAWARRGGSVQAPPRKPPVTRPACQAGQSCHQCKSNVSNETAPCGIEAEQKPACVNTVDISIVTNR